MIPIILSLALLAQSGFAASDESISRDWVIPKICVDAADKPVSADPYGGCPAGDRLRTLAAGDPLPYRKLDNQKQQYKDVYPRTAPDGAEIIVVSFDWLDPHNGGASRFKVWADGYDAYMVREGWASGSETRIGSGEYATTFFGEGCKNYNGLIFFPTSFPASGESEGSAKPAIGTAAWEEDDQKFPGTCPSRYGTDQLFTWSRARNFPFAGIGGAPVKTMDAIVSTMGLRTIKDPKIIAKWMSYGHLEVFYFTRTYGLTRWENWRPDVQFEVDGHEPAAQSQQRAANAAKACSPGPDMTVVSFTPKGSSTAAAKIHMIYQGLPFTMSDCRDWSNIVPQNPPIQPPVWPVSGLNLLRNFHFNGSSLHPLPDWDTGTVSHGELLVSTTKDDTTHDTPIPLRGIAYVRLGCGDGCGAEQLHQDIPISAATPSGSYTVGVIARTEAGTGTLRISLTQMDEKKISLSKVVFLADNIVPEQTGCDSAGKHCRTFAFDAQSKSGSVVLSSDFVSRTFPIEIDPRARKLRFEIAPASSNDFDLVSVWLMRAP